MTRSRPRLVIVVGAGASQSCGLYGTAELTSAAFTPGTYVESTVRYRSKPVDNSDDWQHDQEVWSLTQMFWEALRGSYNDPNFEIYVHALETLGPLAASRRRTNWFGTLDELRPIATLFMDVLSRYEPFLRAEIIQAERLNVIERILTAVSFSLDSTGSSPRRATFLESMRQLVSGFTPTILTLNYDDLLDQAFPDFFDGFHAPHDAVEKFDPASIIDSANEQRSMLFHLHGSVRFGYLPSANAMPPLIVKYANKVDAIQSFARAVESLDAVRGDWVHGGVLRANAPIISGLQKADKLMLAPAPFGYLYHAAISQLLRCNRVLVLGYGCHDPHINAWISEAAKIHGDSYRLAFVTKLDPRLRIPISTPTKDALAYFLRSIDEAAVLWDRREDVKFLGDRLMIVLSGMPLNADLTSDIVTFLNT